jgi:YgiT-type zinc finger domain-containing protein
MRDKENKLPEYLTLCNECQTGVLRLEYITYFTWLDQELITVPNFPAWICDMCGRRSYDTRAVSWLNTLLNPAAGKKNGMIRRRRGRLPGINQPQP